MSCSKLEPIPVKHLTPGDIVYSPGFTEAYEVVSYPLCRLYIDYAAKFVFQPHSFESNPNRKEGNYLSYLVRSLSSKNSEPFYITNQCLKK